MTDHAELVQRLEECLHRQGFDEPCRVDQASYSLRLYHKTNVAEENIVFRTGDDFAFSTGTLFYRCLFGREAIGRLLDDFVPNRFDPRDLYGQFCVGINKGGSLYLLTDRLGLYNVYRDVHDRVYSSSFLAVLESLESVRVNAQSVYEYVFTGATYGNKTVFDEIELIAADRTVRISEDIATLPQKEWVVPAVVERSLDAHVEANLAAARKWFSVIRNCFENNVTTALSGGYDTRLMLAFLLEQGMKPSIYVYGGPENSDVRLASQIARAEGFPLAWVDRSALAKPGRDAFPESVEKTFYAFDGYPSDGIFDNGADLLTRIERSQGGKLQLNGIGADYLRECWLLADVRLTPLAFVKRCCRDFSPRSCTSLFCEKTYFECLAEKLATSLGKTGPLLERTEMEHAWITFRCRYWVSRGASLNHRFGWALMPFLGLEIIEECAKVPMKYRFYGRLQGRMIRELSPALARHRSGYGHDFLHEAPLRRRFDEMLARLRKTYLPMLNAYRLKMMLGRLYTTKILCPTCLQPDYVGSVVPATFPHLSEFFRVDQVVDLENYARVCTLEYLFQKCRASLSRCGP